MTSGLPSLSWFLWFGDSLVLFMPFISTRPWPMPVHHPSKGQPTRAKGQQGVDTQQTHEPTTFLYLGVVCICERATVQDIPIGMKVFLVW